MPPGVGWPIRSCAHVGAAENSAIPTAVVAAVAPAFALPRARVPIPIRSPHNIVFQQRLENESQVFARACSPPVTSLSPYRIALRLPSDPRSIRRKLAPNPFAPSSNPVGLNLRHV